jgi:hypothetical protein
MAPFQSKSYKEIIFKETADEYCNYISVRIICVLHSNLEKHAEQVKVCTVLISNQLESNGMHPISVSSVIIV